MKNAFIALSLMAGAVAFAAPGNDRPAPAPGPQGPGMHKPCAKPGMHKPCAKPGMHKPCAKPGDRPCAKPGDPRGHHTAPGGKFDKRNDRQHGGFNPGPQPGARPIGPVPPTGPVGPRR